MHRTTLANWLLGACGAALYLSPLPAAAQADEKRLPVILSRVLNDYVFVTETEDAAADGKRQPQVRVAVAADKPSEYWLGIALEDLPEVAKEQLGVAHGLVVVDVVDDSPAAKAEIKRHDILIKADGAELKEPADLIKVVDGSQGKEFALVVVRGGKDRQVTVAPMKRAEAKGAHGEERKIDVLVQPEFSDEIKRLEEVLAKLKGRAGGDSLALFFAKPGVVKPQGEVEMFFDSEKGLYKAAEGFIRTIKGEFPKNLSVRITKEGDQPTKIHVKRGDQEWEVSEDKLSELPDDVRPHVQMLLGRMLAPGISAAATRTLKVLPGGKVEGEINVTPVHPAAPRPPAAAVKPAPPAPPQVARLRATRVESGGVEGKLDAIMKKLEELSKEVDELQSRNK